MTDDDRRVYPADEVDRVPTTQEELIHKRRMVGMQLREIELQTADIQMPRVACPCGTKTSVAYAYRCPECGVYLCKPCAQRHIRIVDHSTDEDLHALRAVAKQLWPVDLREVQHYAQYLRDRAEGRT